MEFFTKLFDTSDFPERWNCGNWTAFHGWIHIVSDLAVFGAYMAIPCVVIFFGLRRKATHYPKLFWLFCLFIFACGFVHLIEATIFWTPIYRISAVTKFLTAIFSWATVVGLVQFAPKALELPTLQSLIDQLEEKNRRLEQTQTQLKIALAESDRSKRLLDATIESTYSGVVISDLETNFVLINPAGRKMMGKLSDVPPEDWDESVGLFESEEGRLLLQHELPLHRAIRGESTKSVEILIRNGVDKDPIWLSSNATQILNRNNKPIGAVAVFDDITEQRRSRELLRELQQETATKLDASNRQLAEVLSAIPQALWRGEVGDDGFDFVYFSPGIERITGRTPDELIGDIAYWVSKIHGDDRDRIKKLIKKTIEGGLDELEVEYRVLHKDGSFRWIQNRFRAETKDDKRQVQGIMTDITEERDANQALIRAERLASIGTLAAGIAHEINNPLGAMMLTTDRGKAQVSKGNYTSEQIGSTFDDIMGQIERCSKIVTSVLKFASNETSERKVGSLFSVADESRDFILFKAKRKNISILLSENKVDPIVNMNETEMGQVFVNVFANAIDASPADSEIKVDFKVEDRRVMCAIIDQGKGMDSKAKQLAFDPFYTSKRTDGGTGLGLSLSHTIVTRHGGEIWIDDTEIERGTTVRFWLPHAESARNDG